MDHDVANGVRDLVLRYADAINLYQLDTFADVFAEDATWEVIGHWKQHGREAIRDTFAEVRNRFEWVVQVVHGTRILSAGDGTAQARSYMMEHGRLRGEGYSFVAVYQDHCVNQNGVWRFQHCHCQPIYSGPPDLSALPRLYPPTALF